MARLTALLACMFVLWSGAALAQATPAAAPTATIDSRILPPIGADKPVVFDPQKATNAYLARVSGTARARSDAYFEGGYALILVDTLYAIAVAALLLWFRISANIRDFAERQTRSRFWQVPLYAGPYILITTALSFPLTLFENFFRERSYGLMNQTFLGWFGDFLTMTGVDLILTTVALTIGYWAIRQAGRNWWIWAAALFIAFNTVVTVISPVVIDPLFNKYTPLPDSPLKRDVLSLARANGIPAHDVFLVDASRQSDRISANVAGFLGTTRIALNDNLLKHGTHDEILAVLGHEMGHYVLDHQSRGLALFGLLALAGFAFMSAGFSLATSLFGGNWDVRTVDDPAGLPLLAALAAIFLLLATPITNSITRTMEVQADMFGINAARKPDAFATAVLKLSSYRKLDPAPWEEAIFYDHPSGRTRIWEMMRWKAEHLNDPDIKAGPQSPQ
ncbi:MAG TPA: M48 family metallopeptidase [Rhizomicrobium sp.]|jgi:STE24 endopeptidase|nr:M48 family metallopeptidase [Rhizomicrobium sp.]